MVQVLRTKFEYNHNFSTASSAYFQRYAIQNNPYSRNVNSCDIIRAELSGTTPHLIVERLIHKTGSLPGLIKVLLGNITDSYVLETSVIDPKQKTMHCWTRNIDHRRIIHVEEQTTYRGTSATQTEVETIVRFRSGLRFGLRERIEKLSHQYFLQRLANSRQGMKYVMETLMAGRLAAHNLPAQP